MRLRTKLFLSWGLLVLLLWAGSLWPVQRTIAANFTQVASAGFDGTRHGLNALQAERVQRMRQAGRLIMTIPGLRALIAENSSEVSSENHSSLEERLDSLAETTGVSFVCVLDGRGRLIAQNSQSPWSTLAGLRDYLLRSAQSKSLVQRVFGAAPNSAAGASDVYGLWVYNGKLFQVVGLPLIFGGGGDGTGGEADGALVMATPMTDEQARELGSSHHCEVSFLAGVGAGEVVASSLPVPQRGALKEIVSRNLSLPVEAFDAEINGAAYRCSLEPLLDPCSNAPVGAMLIQSSLAEARAAQAKLSRMLLAILFTGLGAAALGSFLLSGVITRPVAALLAGVRRIAEGDLESEVKANRGDELGKLAVAFNDMVVQLRTRRELQRQVEISQAASRAKSQFLANMSHEIRTPLNGVIGMAELLMATELTQRQRRYASLAKSSAEILTVLINDILDFSKIEAGKLEIESADFGVTGVVEDVVEMLASKAYSKRLEISSDIARDIPLIVRGDANRVRQILINLVNNAIKFTETGAVAVRVAIQSRTEEAMLLRFCVSDSGIGIPTERLDRLFKSFSQVDASTTRKYGGTGLGLAISKQLAELMGGAIGVESEAGRGSTFWFTIAVKTEAGGPSAVRLPAFQGLRVLVSQANATTGALICRWLTELGAETMEINGLGDAGRVLMAAASEGRAFDWAIVGDAGKSLRGIDFCASCRGVPVLEKLKYLLLVRADQECDAVKLTNAGVHACIALPLRHQQLVEAIAGGAAGSISPSAISSSSEAPTQRMRTSLTKPATGGGTAGMGGAAGLNGVRILLAEDNEVNQLIVTDLLANAGYPCDVVADGIKAAEAATSGDYGLMLMDCQMPGMDGFEATRVIREKERGTAGGAGSAGSVGGGNTPARHLPIIALTANAISGDRERCLEAGMDAYCTKPIEAQGLIEVIRELLQKYPLHQGHAESNVAAGNANDAHPGASGYSTSDNASKGSAPATAAIPLDMESLLRRCTGNTALASRVLQKLTDQAAASLKQLEQYAMERDAQGVARIAHSLKGAAAMAAAEPLRMAALRLEEMSRGNDLSGIAGTLSEIREELKRCEIFVQQRAAGRLAEISNPSISGSQ